MVNECKSDFFKNLIELRDTAQRMELERTSIAIQTALHIAFLENRSSPFKKKSRSDCQDIHHAFRSERLRNMRNKPENRNFFN